MPDKVLSQQEREIVEQIQRGRNLRELVQSPGWADLLTIMADRVDAAQFHLLNTDSTDGTVLLCFHRRARAYAEFAQSIEKEVYSLIEQSTNVIPLVDASELDAPLAEPNEPLD